MRGICFQRLGLDVVISLSLGGWGEGGGLVSVTLCYKVSVVRRIPWVRRGLLQFASSHSKEKLTGGRLPLHGGRYVVLLSLCGCRPAFDEL